MTGGFRVSQSAIDADHFALMANDPADPLTLRTGGRVIELLGLPLQRLLGETECQLLAEPMGQLLNLRERNVFWTIVLAKSGVEWVVGGSREEGVDGALNVGIRRWSERHGQTPSMDWETKSVSFRSN
jgi:hypothetical protein